MIEKASKAAGCRDSEYHRFVSGKPCVVDGVPGEAHHFGDMYDGRGVGHKATDQKLVPLCHSHHREVEKLGRAGFEQKYGVNFDVTSDRLHLLYKERHG